MEKWVWRSGRGEVWMWRSVGVEKCGCGEVGVEKCGCGEVWCGEVWVCRVKCVWVNKKCGRGVCARAYVRMYMCKDACVWVCVWGEKCGDVVDVSGCVCVHRRGRGNQPRTVLQLRCDSEHSNNPS